MSPEGNWVPESDRVKWLVEQMWVTPPDENRVRYVELAGLPVGKFRQDEVSGRWQYQWLSRQGFEAGRMELAPAQEEHVEYWAVTEIARMIDWDEQDRSG